MATDTINVPLPADRRYSRPYEITLSDTLADQNLKRNGVPYLFIQNVGTGGSIVIRWEPDDIAVDVYLAQGQILEGGLWRHAMLTGTVGGADLRGFLGTKEH